MKGNGVTKDLVQAVEWYERAAEQGLAEAQYYLWPFATITEKGVEKRPRKKAAMWCEKAAEQGIAVAQYYLGCCYEDGKGVTKTLLGRQSGTAKLQRVAM